MQPLNRAPAPANLHIIKGRAQISGLCSWHGELVGFSQSQAVAASLLLVVDQKSARQHREWRSTREREGSQNPWPPYRDSNIGEEIIGARRGGIRSRGRWLLTEDGEGGYREEPPSQGHRVPRQQRAAANGRRGEEGGGAAVCASARGGGRKVGSSLALKGKSLTKHQVHPRRQEILLAHPIPSFVWSLSLNIKNMQ